MGSRQKQQHPPVCSSKNEVSHSRPVLWSVMNSNPATSRSEVLTIKFDGALEVMQVPLGFPEVLSLLPC